MMIKKWYDEVRYDGAVVDNESRRWKEEDGGAEGGNTCYIPQSIPTDGIVPTITVLLLSISSATATATTTTAGTTAGTRSPMSTCRHW